MSAATDPPFLDTSHRRYRYQAAESELHLPGTGRPTDADRQPYRHRLYPTVDITAHQHENQHLLGVRFLHQAIEVAYVVLRYQADG